MGGGGNGIGGGLLCVIGYGVVFVNGVGGGEKA